MARAGITYQDVANAAKAKGSKNEEYGTSHEGQYGANQGVARDK